MENVKVLQNNLYASSYVLFELNKISLNKQQNILYRC